MRVQPCTGGTYGAEPTDDVRSCSPTRSSTCSRETAFGAEILDRLADALVLAGMRPSAPRAPAGWRRDASAQS